MSVEVALTQQLLNKPSGAAKVPLVAASTIQRGDSIVINDEGKAVTASYNRIPDNVINESFFDYVDPLSSTSGIMQNSRDRIMNIGGGYFLGMNQQTNGSRYDVYLYTWKVDTATQTGNVVSSVTITNDISVYNNGSFNDLDFAVTPQRDYVMVYVMYRTSSSGYASRFYRVAMNPTTRSLSAKTYLAQPNSGSSTHAYADFVGSAKEGESGYQETGSGTALNERWFWFNQYYSSSFDSIKRINLEGGVSQVSSQSGMPSYWQYIHDDSMSYNNRTLLYYPASGYVNTFDMAAGATSSSSYYDRIQVQSATNGSDGVNFSTGNFFFGSPVAINGKAYWCMWDGSRQFTTFRFNVGSGKASFDGKYTYTITDSNMLISMARTSSGFKYGGRWERDGTSNDYYGLIRLNEIHSLTTDTPEDAMHAMIKLNFSTSGGGHYYPTFQGFVDARGVNSGQNDGHLILDSNGITAFVYSSDFSTTDNTNHYKHGIFEISDTGVADPEYAFGVKAIALENASAGQTFDALSYAPAFYDSALTPGANYNTHIVSSTDYLLEKS
jgi:hypothetical protein